MREQLMNALSQYGQSLQLPSMSQDQEMMFDLYANRPDFAKSYYPALDAQNRTGLEGLALQQKLASGGDSPAAIREWQYYNSLPPQDQQRYLQMKRSDQIMNLGGSMAVRSPMGGIQEQYTVTPKIVDSPEFNALVARAVEDAKNKSTAISESNKKSVQATSSNETIDEILRPDETGRSLLDKATGSSVGNVIASGKQIFGVSDESTQANAALTVLGGKLVANVPRMEGPQSNIDVAFYKEQAGKIADPTIPAGDKKAALSAIMKLNEKYATKEQDPMQSWLDAAQQQNINTGGMTQPPNAPIITPLTAPQMMGERSVKKYNPATGKIE